jgi:hypothetical protein
VSQTKEATATRFICWRVTAFDRAGHRLSVSHPLHAQAARQQHAYWSAHPSTQLIDGHQSRVTAAEEITDKTERVIGLPDLPGPGEPTPLPELPDGAHEVRRFYAFSHGPRVHRTADHARGYLAWLTERQENPTPTTVHVDLTALALYEVTLTFYQRPVDLAEIPENS